jgi:uncharacterized membrane protein
MHIPYIFTVATEFGDDVSKGRIETLTDGIFAIVMTILVLEITVPHLSHSDASSLLPNIFLNYGLFFLAMQQVLYF